jgi:hypothetical protein
MDMDKVMKERIMEIRREAGRQLMKVKDVADKSGINIANVSKIFKASESKDYAQNPIYSRYVTDGNLTRLEKAVGIKRPKPKADASGDGEK